MQIREKLCSANYQKMSWLIVISNRKLVSKAPLLRTRKGLFTPDKMTPSALPTSLESETTAF